MCGAPKQGGALAGIDLSTQTVIQGQVWHDGAPVAGAYVRLLDQTDEFSGKILAPAHLPQEMAQKGGHVPTAINIPWSKAANEDGTFKSDEELAKLYAEAGLDEGKDTIAYCRIGERSSHTWFALHELLGYSDVKNYDGSWTEYGSLVGVPVEIGPGAN